MLLQDVPHASGQAMIAVLVWISGISYTTCYRGMTCRNTVRITNVYMVPYVRTYSRHKLGRIFYYWQPATQQATPGPTNKARAAASLLRQTNLISVHNAGGAQIPTKVPDYDKLRLKSSNFAYL